MDTHFFSWRDDQTHRLAFLLTPALREALRQIRPHAIHLYVNAENDLPEWAIGQLTSTLYTTGNRFLLRFISGRKSIEQLTYNEAELFLRILALTTLKALVRGRANSAFSLVFETFCQLTPVAVSRKPLPPAGNSTAAMAWIYEECRGTGTTHLDVTSIYGLIDAVRSRELEVPVAGRDFVALLDEEFLLFTVALHLLRNP